MSTPTFREDMGFPAQVADHLGWTYGSSDSFAPIKVTTSVGEVFIRLGSLEWIGVSTHDVLGTESTDLMGKRQITLSGLLDLEGREWLSADVETRRFFARITADEREQVLDAVATAVREWIAVHPQQVRTARVDAAREKARVISDHAQEARDEARRELARAERLDDYAAEARAHIERLQSQA